MVTDSLILSSFFGLIGFSIPLDGFVEVVPPNLTDSARNWTLNRIPASITSTTPSNQASCGGYKSAVPSEFSESRRRDGPSVVHFLELPCYLAFAIAGTVAPWLRGLD